MKVSVFVGSVVEAMADAVCSSTNPRLSLVMGTGAAIRLQGGPEVLRACEEILREHGAALPPGTAYVTTAGTLPHRIAIHCVASDAAHRSSDAIVASCVNSALRCAGDRGCRSVALPIFATGHVHADFARTVKVMVGSLLHAQTPVEQVVLVVFDPEDASLVQQLLERAFGAPVTVETSLEEPLPARSWLDDDDDSRW
jgi:O-acetyl-ADP-ribose deacetylase (regulator of RNase III)